MEQWFGRCDATHLIHNASLDSSVNDAFLQCECIMTWTNVESHASHIIAHVATTKPYSAIRIMTWETVHIYTC